jgi:hypothetical protein
VDMEDIGEETHPLRISEIDIYPQGALPRLDYSLELIGREMLTHPSRLVVVAAPC